MKTKNHYNKKEEYVYSIFSSISHRYDLLNTTLSFNRDKYWRRFTVSQTGIKKDSKVLDVCCGTGMLTIELAKKAVDGKVVGLDFCENMLEKAHENLKKTGMESNIELIQGKATELPFEDNTFDCATIAFALRNVPDVEKTITEMKRVVKNKGSVVSLELSKPSVPVLKQAYYFYFNRLVPLFGKLGVGQDGPYSYLPGSVMAFPHQKEIKKLFQNLGLTECTYYELTGGIATVHVGIKK